MNDPQGPATASGRWVLVAGASLLSVGMAAYEISPASVTPLIRESLGVDGPAAGLLVGVMFGTAMVTSLPLGAVLDRTNSRPAIAVATGTLLVAGAWGYGAATNGSYLSLLASRILGALGFVVVWNAGIDVVSQAFNDTRRATAVGVFTASGPVGFALGQAAGPVVAARFGWPAVLVAFNIVALAGLVVFWPVSRGLGEAAGDPPDLAAFTGVLRNRAVWLVGALGFLAYALYLFVNSWGPSYLTESVGLSLSVSGLVVALFPAVGILSRMGSGALSDRLFGGRRRPVLFASFVVTTPLVVAVAYLRGVAALIVALLIVGFALQLTIGLSFAYIRELVAERVAATAVAFQTAVGLSGAFVAPVAGGAVIGRAGYTLAFLLAGGLAALGALLAWWAPEPGGQAKGF